MKPLQTSLQLRNASLGAAVIALGNQFDAGGFSGGLGGSMPPNGVVCLANDSLLRQESYIEELTSFAISYDAMRGNGLRNLRDFFAPTRPSNSRIVRLTTYDENEPWQSVAYNAAKRGILANFMDVPQRVASKSDLQIVNRGLSVTLDRDQLNDNPQWQELHTKWLLDLLMLATVLETVTLLEASAIVANLTWDSASNPDLDVKQAVLNLANTTGFYPTRIIYGDQAALIRQTAYETQLTAGSLARAGRFTQEEVATAVGIDKCIINAERYQTQTGTTKQEIIGSNVLIFTAVDGTTPMDPSNIVRHTAAAAYGGGDYAVYVTPVGVKKIVLTVENYEYLHVQHTTGLEQLAVIA